MKCIKKFVPLLFALNYLFSNVTRFHSCIFHSETATLNMGSNLMSSWLPIQSVCRALHQSLKSPASHDVMFSPMHPISLSFLGIVPVALFGYGTSPLIDVYIYFNRYGECLQML